MCPLWPLPWLPGVAVAETVLGLLLLLAISSDSGMESVRAWLPLLAPPGECEASSANTSALSSVELREWWDTITLAAPPCTAIPLALLFLLWLGELLWWVAKAPALELDSMLLPLIPGTFPDWGSIGQLCLLA